MTPLLFLLFAVIVTLCNAAGVNVNPNGQDVKVTGSVTQIALNTKLGAPQTASVLKFANNKSLVFTTFTVTLVGKLDSLAAAFVTPSIMYKQVTDNSPQAYAAISAVAQTMIQNALQKAFPSKTANLFSYDAGLTGVINVYSNSGKRNLRGAEEKLDGFFTDDNSSSGSTYSFVFSPVVCITAAAAATNNKQLSQAVVNANLQAAFQDLPMLTGAVTSVLAKNSFSYIKTAVDHVKFTSSSVSGMTTSNSVKVV